MEPQRGCQHSEGVREGLGGGLSGCQGHGAHREAEPPKRAGLGALCFPAGAARVA